MPITKRRYKLYSDFPAVGAMLRENFDRYGSNGNIPQPAWEYAHTHPCFNHRLTHRFGVWEDSGEIVGVAFYEMDVGEAMFACRRGYERLKLEMVGYAEEELSAPRDGGRRLTIVAGDAETDLRDSLAGKGYALAGVEDVTAFDYAEDFRAPPLPEGFKVVSLAEENDIRKIHAVLWKGFDHGDQPDDDLDCRLQMQSGPSFSEGLTTVVKAPNGEYACFAGMWMDGANDFAYLEPLATAPEYRGIGLASIALREGMRKTAERGATYCFGGDSAFYTKHGFRVVGRRERWERSWR